MKNDLLRLAPSSRRRKHIFDRGHKLFPLTNPNVQVCLSHSCIKICPSTPDISKSFVNIIVIVAMITAPTT